MTKPFHAAHAARDAVVATQHARLGLTADVAALEGDIGYFRLLGDGAPQTIRLPSGDTSNNLLASGLSVKRYPCCYNIHRTADAALALHGRTDLGRVERITVTLEPGGLDPLIHHRPSSGTEAKFSAEYVAAVSIIDGSLGLATFDDERALEPDVQALLRRVEVVESAMPPVGPPEWDFAYSVVQVEADGRTLVERTDIPTGHRTRPLADTEMDVMFLDCLAYADRTDGVDVLASLREPDASRPISHYRM
ncbi:hypothetical protein JCM18899A_38990 [Nocardioides sp. AN3]